MLVVAVRVEYSVGHCGSGLAVSVTVHPAVPGRGTVARCRLAGIAVPSPAPGVDGGGGGGTGLLAWAAAAVAGLAEADAAPARARPGTTMPARASAARPVRADRPRSRERMVLKRIFPPI